MENEILLHIFLMKSSLKTPAHTYPVLELLLGKITYTQRRMLNKIMVYTQNLRKLIYIFRVYPRNQIALFPLDLKTIYLHKETISHLTLLGLMATFFVSMVDFIVQLRHFPRFDIFFFGRIRWECPNNHSPLFHD